MYLPNLNKLKCCNFGLRFAKYFFITNLETEVGKASQSIVILMLFKIKILCICLICITEHATGLVHGALDVTLSKRIHNEVGISKDKNTMFKSSLKEGTAVIGGLGLCIPITLHCNLPLNNLKTTAHTDTKFHTVN